MNKWGGERKAFFFLISYDEEKCIVCPPEDLPDGDFIFNYNGLTNENFIDSEGGIAPMPENEHSAGLHDDNSSALTGHPSETEEVEDSISSVRWKAHPESYDIYRHSFGVVHRNICRGNSFLLNLTCRTPIDTNLSLSDIYRASKAKYKLLWKNHFTMFSPEIFVQIKGQSISTFPMKGTIEAETPEAAQRLLEDKKEAAEHATIVDLLRNDLSMVASHVRVERYRYLDTLVTHRGKLLQTSSKITGLLTEDFHTRLGDIFFTLLPAGSVTGAPKKKTLAIIREAENYDRGFYTGVTGFFDGQNLDSAVIIRFVEKEADGQLYFKSGGGITFQSDSLKEYQEMIDKIYVPIY